MSSRSGSMTARETSPKPAEDKASLLEKGAPAPPPPPAPGAKQLLFCFIGLQASYLTWGYVQEKVMTKEYSTGRFPSATFCVFSNRVLAVTVAWAVTMYKHGGKLNIPAPLWVFAPCALSNTLSSFGQYQALHYVSFPLQTIAKSTKVIPVMIMGKVLNKKTYPCVDYIEAVLICLGVSLFSLANVSADFFGGGTSGDASSYAALAGLAMLALYIVSDSFTSQWQSRLYQAHPTVDNGVLESRPTSKKRPLAAVSRGDDAPRRLATRIKRPRHAKPPQVDQFQMMFAVNTWAIIMTTFALVTSGELWTTLQFIGDNPIAFLDNVTIAITSATGQLFIFYTIKTFGPIVFTIIMTTRQMFSIVLSTVIFGHAIKPLMGLGAVIVFATIFNRIKRQAAKRKQAAPAVAAGK